MSSETIERSLAKSIDSKANAFDDVERHYNPPLRRGTACYQAGLKTGEHTRLA